MLLDEGGHCGATRRMARPAKGEHAALAQSEEGAEGPPIATRTYRHCNLNNRPQHIFELADSDER